jgi:hypothetical protein
MEVFTRIASGDSVVFPTNNVEKCGNVIVVGDTREEAVRMALAALDWISIQLEPLQDSTTAHLFHHFGNDAFETSDPVFLARLRGLPPFLGNPENLKLGELVAVLKIPELASLSCRDWHGLLPSEAVRKAIDGKGMLVDGATGHGGFILGGLFWKAILRGSAQGGRYLLDCIQESVRRGSLKQFLAGL